MKLGPVDPNAGLAERRRRRTTTAVMPFALLALVVAVGLLGRLVPSTAPGIVRTDAPEGSAAAATKQPVIRLVSPVASVVWLRATEIGVRGLAAEGIAQLDVSVLSGGRLMGQTVLDVAVDGRFDGVVSITPPAARSTAVLEVRDAASGEQLTDVSFSIEAGSIILIRDASRLNGVAGTTVVVDVIVYQPLREVRGLVTSPGGTLVAEAATPVAGFDGRSARLPSTVALRIALPATGVPSHVRLHVLGIDTGGTEIAHVDANIRVSAGE
jgi:hypothetical protein